MSASSRAAVALILTLLGRCLRAQSAADSGTAGAPKQISRSSDAPRAGERTVEQPVIDAARLVRERGVRDLSDLLTDRVPGMLVVPGSGLTDKGSRIRVRGVQTLVGDRAPVVFVDGMRMDQTEDDFEPVSNGVVASGPLRLDDLSPEDVESIEVVEGPASAAVYGPGAAAGVLLIHTKRGRPGPPRWEAYAAGGVAAERTSWPANFGGVDRDNPDSLYRSGLCSLFAEAAGWCVQDFVQQFNPLAQRSPFRTALRRDYGLSLSGGSGFGDYRLAGDFEGDGGLYSSSVATSDPNYYRRVNVRVSGSIRPWPSLDIRGSGAYLSSNLRLPPSIPLLQTVFGPSDSTGFTWNPFFQNNAGTQALERPFGLVEAHWTPLSWLTLRGLAGTDKVDLRYRWVSSVSTDTTRRLVVAGHRETLHRTLELGASATHALSGSVRLRATLAVQHVPVRHAVGAPAVAGLLFPRKHRPPRARVRDRCDAPRPLRCDRREHHVSERGRVVAGARRGLRLVQSAAAASDVRLRGSRAVGVPAPGTWLPSSCWLRVAPRARAGALVRARRRRRPAWRTAQRCRHVL